MFFLKAYERDILTTVNFCRKTRLSSITLNQNVSISQIAKLLYYSFQVHLLSVMENFLLIWQYLLHDLFVVASLYIYSIFHPTVYYYMLAYDVVFFLLLVNIEAFCVLAFG